MEFEFDKERDASLRKAHGGLEATASPPAHLDADELAAFAENAVPAAARLRYLAHLADCTRCRKILSNVVLSNPEADAKAASAAVAAPAAEERAPWYRRFFAFPQLAYAMGAMVVVFSAFFAYLIIRNLPGASNSDVSFSTQPALQEKRAPANAASAPSAASNTTANSNAAATNSSAPPVSTAPANTSASTANAASVPTGSANVAAAKPELPEKPVENAPYIAPQATPPADARLDDKTMQRAERDDLAKSSPASPTAGAVSENRAKEEEKKKDAPKSDVSDEDSSGNKLMSKRKQPSPKTVEKTPSTPGDRRIVGGKTFDNIGGAWYDRAVGGKKQKTVRRGTSEYLKLDAGLRSIADQLGGTVVVLWGGKAYRIE